MAGCIHSKNRFYVAPWYHGHILLATSTIMCIGIHSLVESASLQLYKLNGVNYSNPMGMVRWSCLGWSRKPLFRQVQGLHCSWLLSLVYPIVSFDVKTDF